MKCTLQTVPHFNTYRLKEKKLMSYLSLKKGEHHLYKSCKTNLIFVMKGSITVTYDTYKNTSISSDSIFLIPVDKIVYVVAKEDSVFVCISFYAVAQYYDKELMDPYIKTISNKNNQIKVLKLNDLLKGISKLISSCIEDNVVCNELIVQIKMEISWVLTNFYPPKEFAEFIYTCLNDDEIFKESVLSNYLKVTNVTALCRLLGYSSAVFSTKMKHCFNEVPNTWFKHKRAEAILQDIYTTRPIAEIALHYNFKSLLRFNAYCKTTYGLAPKKLREVIDNKRASAIDK